MPKTKPPIIWNVYYHDMNSKEIKSFNVFAHPSFSESVAKLLKEKLPRDEFSKALRSEAIYYFWSKCEHEIVLTSWPPYITADERKRLSEEEQHFHHNVRLEVGAKVDVFQQLDLNWDRFVDYTYGGATA